MGPALPTVDPREVGQALGERNLILFQILSVRLSACM